MSGSVCNCATCVLAEQIAAQIECRRQDPVFMARLKARVENDRQLLAKLGRS